ATVTGVNWQRSIVLEQYGDVTREDWKDNIPSNAVLGNCQQRVSGQSDQPVDNGNKVCGTPYLVDQGNGYAESVQDCYYEVVSDYCSYTVRDWGPVDTLIASGSDMSPYWPDVPVRDDLREGNRNETYSVNFGWDSGNTNYSVSSESEFRQFTPGSTWNLDINTFGQIMSVNP
ncbi:MAG: hypothetical protein HGA53_09080, partial [Anaerolineaceae bacterium]|nr:hypothetical protein [Anaerolineaceae bacterium]